MKKRIATVLLVLGVLAMALPASAHRYDRTTDGHPLQWVGWAGHAIGIGLEYAIARPLHWVVSRNDLDIVFGHEVYASDEGTYFEWVHGDYSPSIKKERMERQEMGQKPAQ